MFNIIEATSQSALNQLSESYTNVWGIEGGSYTIDQLFNLWYYTETFNQTIVICRGYYLFFARYFI
jgi:hypothetical protein